MRRGFTLIELLAVITILSIIVLVASISVSDMLKESKKELSAAQIRSIKESAKSWSSDNMDILPIGNNCSFIMLKDLKDTGLLDSKVINPKDNKNIPNETKIKITSKIGNNGKSILDYEVDSDDISECTYIGSNMYVDLPKGLTPVLYDKKINSWRVPEINEEWYNYDKQEWANAVVLGKGKTKKPGDTVAVDGTEALMMLVYIPRYEYKIEGQYGKGGTDEYHPGEIEVNFISKNTTTPTFGYHINNAFTFDGEKAGFWVGKFEISHTTLSSSETENSLECNTINCQNAEGLRILPNVPSLRENNVSNLWYGIKSIENKTNIFGLTNMDAHMMKNSEWGAVAYLSQSKYGKYGNSDYEGTNKEVYQNKSINNITGLSNGTPSQDESYTQCTYNQKKGTNTNQDQNNCGPGASTTGNIYGVYDMSGGAHELIMGVYGDSQGIYSGRKVSGNSNSGFNGRTGYDNGNITNGAQVPDSKYYDIYMNSTNDPNDDGSHSCNNGICYGHALSEIKGNVTIKGWYADSTYMIYSGYPWFLRGGSHYSSDSAAGIFMFTFAEGKGHNFSTRVVVFGK